MVFLGKEFAVFLLADSVYRGRKKSLTPDRMAALRRRAPAGEKKAQLAREFGISRETLCQYLKTND